MLTLVVVLVAQLYPTLCDPMDCSPPGSSVHGILQARILEWIAIPFSRGSSWPYDQTWVYCVASRFFTIWATRKTWILTGCPTNLTQFWHYLPWESVRSHMLRAQSHKTVPTPLQLPITNPDCYLCFWPLTISWRFQPPPQVQFICLRDSKN